MQNEKIRIGAELGPQRVDILLKMEQGLKAPITDLIINKKQADVLIRAYERILIRKEVPSIQKLEDQLNKDRERKEQQTRIEGIARVALLGTAAGIGLSAPFGFTVPGLGPVTVTLVTYLVCFGAFLAYTAHYDKMNENLQHGIDEHSKMIEKSASLLRVSTK